MALTEAQRQAVDALEAELADRPDETALLAAFEPLRARAEALRARDFPAAETDALIAEMRAFVATHPRPRALGAWIAGGVLLAAVAGIALAVWHKQRHRPPSDGHEDGVRLTRVSLLERRR